MPNIINILKMHGRTIIEVIGVLSIVLALLQLNVQNQQFAQEKQQFLYELSQALQLMYSYSLVVSETDQEVISQAANHLSERFYDLVYQKAQSNPDEPYLNAVDSTLPITTTIPAQPLAILVRIHNSGLTTASKVRVILDISRPIFSIDVDSLEPHRIIEGGMKENFATIEIDRIVAGDSVSVTITSNQADMEQLDQIVVQNSNSAIGFERNVIFRTSNGHTVYFLISEMEGRKLDVVMEEDGRITKATIPLSNRPDNSLALSELFFPQIKYIPAEEPFINVSVTAHEGPASLTSTPVP